MQTRQPQKLREVMVGVQEMTETKLVILGREYQVRTLVINHHLASFRSPEAAGRDYRYASFFGRNPKP